MNRSAMFATLLCLAAPAFCTDGPLAQKVHREGNYFEVTEPAGWSEDVSYLGLSPDEKKVYGVKLTAPAHGTASAPMMSAHYYAPGNLMDETADNFIRGHLTKAVKGPRGPKAKAGKVGGIKAKLFGGVSYEASEPHSLKAERIEIWESYAVLPLKKGYYVLRYSAPAADFNAGMPVFEAFVASFKPLLK